MYITKDHKHTGWCLPQTSEHNALHTQMPEQALSKNVF